MKVTNTELLRAVPALRELIQIHLPVRASFKLARLVREVEQVANDIERARAALVERYGERDAAGEFTPVVDSGGDVVEGRVNLTDPESFARELNELLGTAVELRAEAILLEELGETAEVSPATLLALGALLVGEPAEVA